MAHVGFLGTGHIAAPMARALATRGHSVIVSRRNETVSAALAREHDSISVADNQEVLDHSDVVILSLRAQVAQDRQMAQLLSPEARRWLEEGSAQAVA